jgi:phage terminase large subunit GpA-like protein
MSLSLLDDLVATADVLLAPPPAPASLQDFSKRIILPEAGRGGFAWGMHPAQTAALLLWACGRWPRLVLIAPAQDGKTTALILILLHELIERRQPVVYAATDRRLVAALWRAKIRATMLASGMGDLLPEQGLGAGGGSPDDVLIGLARLYMLGAGASNGAGQAGITGRTVIIDEAGKLRRPQFAYLQDRNRSYGLEARTLVSGTLERDQDDLLLAEYDRSTAGRMVYPCPHCGAWQRLEWAQVDLERAVLTCTSERKCTITDDDRQAILPLGRFVHRGQSIDAQGQVVGHPIATETAGVRWTCLDSPLRNLGKLVAEYRAHVAFRETYRDHEPMRQFHHAELVEIYTDDESDLQVHEQDLAIRSAQAAYEAGTIPAEADLVTGAIDVQWRRLYWVILAYACATGTWWIIDHGRLGLSLDGDDATPEQMRAGLDRLRARFIDGFPVAGKSERRPVDLVAVDTADGATRPNLLPWLRGRKGWWPTRGQSDRQEADPGSGRVVEQVPGVLTAYRKEDSLPVWVQLAIHVDALKEEVMRALARPMGTPAAGHLPPGEAADGELVRELCAERKESTLTGWRWVRRHKHNHRLDGTVYALALAKWRAARRAGRVIKPKAVP